MIGFFLLLFFEGKVIEGFQNLRQVCSRNSLLVQFLCCFTKQTRQYITKTKTKKQKKKHTLLRQKMFWGMKCFPLSPSQNDNNFMTPRQMQGKRCFPFHFGQSQGHLEDAAEVLSLLVDLKWQTMCDAQQPHHLVPRNTSGDGESQFERTQGSVVIYTEETGATFKFQSEGAEWVTAQQWWMLL